MVEEDLLSLLLFFLKLFTRPRLVLLANFAHALIDHAVAHDDECLSHRVLAGRLERAHPLHESTDQLRVRSERFGDWVARLGADFADRGDLVFTHREELSNEVALEHGWLDQTGELTDLLSLHLPLAPVIFARFPRTCNFINIRFSLLELQLRDEFGEADHDALSHFIDILHEVEQDGQELRFGHLRAKDLG